MTINRRMILSGMAATALFSLASKAAAQTSVAAYAQLPLLENLCLSPDGRRIAYTSRQDVNQLVVVHDLETDKRHYTAVDNGRLRYVKWVGNDHVLLLSETRYQNYELGMGVNDYALGALLDPFTGRIYQLFTGDRVANDTLNSAHNPRSTRPVSKYPIVGPPFHTFTHGGKPYITSTGLGFSNILGAFTPDTSGYFLMDSTFRSTQWVIQPNGVLHMRSDYSATHKAWLLSRYAPDKKPDADLRFFQPEGFWEEVLRLKVDIDMPVLEGLGRDGQSVVIYMDGYFHEASLTGEISAPLPIEGENIDLIFHPETQQLAGYTHKPLWPEYVYFDPELAALQQKIKDIFGAYRVMVVSRAHDPSKVLLYGEAIDDSGTYYLADLGSGDIEEYARPYGHIDDDKVCPQEVITYQASDGLSIEAIVTYPVGASRRQLPFIVLPHGGPQAHDSLQFDYMAQCFAAHGYAVLQPNYRGSTGYGLDFVNAGHGEWGRRMQTDLSDGVASLTSEGIADPTRVSIVGASYGGYAALAGVALQQGIYNCAVSISGVSDLHRINDWEVRESRSRKARRVLYWQRFMGDRQYWDERSPYRQAHRIEVPVLLIHGEDDEVVPMEQSLMMAAALKQNKKEHTLLRLKGEDHYMTFGHTRLEMLTATLRFLQQHNPVTVA